MAKWISVNDEIPSCEFTVFAIVIDYSCYSPPSWHFDIVHFTHRGDKRYFFQFEDCDGECVENEVIVTHWQRLPKLPSKDEIMRVAKATYPEVAVHRPKPKAQPEIFASDLKYRACTTLPEDSPFYKKPDSILYTPSHIATLTD